MTAPINTNIGGDLQKALNTRYNGDIGETYKRAFQNSRVNKWSWHKPVRHPSYGYDMRNLTPGDDGFNGSQPVGEYCLGSLEFPFAQSLGTVNVDNSGNHTVNATGFLGKLMRGELNWNYRYPRGVDNTYTEPYRLFDLIGYYKGAPCPLPTPPSGERSHAGAITLIVSIPTVVNTAGMSLSSMLVPSSLVAGNPALNTFYLGLLLYKSDYSDCFWKTSEYPINADTVENKERKVSFTEIDGKFGTYKARTFLSATPLTYCENPQVIPEPGTFLMFIAGDPEEATLVFTESQDPSDVPDAVPLSAKWISAAGDTTPTQIRATVTIVNTSGINSVALSNVRMEVIQGLLEDVVATRSFDTPTSLATKTAQTYMNLFTNLTYDEDTKLKFYCTMTETGQSPVTIEQTVILS